MDDQEDMRVPADAREAPPQALDKRRPGLRSAGSHLPKVTDGVLRKRGFVEASLVNDWPAVVGEAVARVTRPDRLSFPKGERSGGTLHLVVSGANALEMQHKAPMLVERINMVFGYAAIARIVLRRGHLAPPPKRVPSRRETTEEAKADIAARVRTVGDEALRDALSDLGNHVLAKPAVSMPRPRRRS
jgi:hypothetical protein